MTAPGTDVDLGHGVTGTYVQGPSPDAVLPAGLLVDHGTHFVLVPWAGDFERLYQLDALLPLTVGGVIRCPICGVAGNIERGAWVPAPSDSEVGGGRGA